MDDYYLDGIIGFIPVVGDVVSYAFHGVFVYIALFKLHSKRLALVIIFNAMKDMVLGLIPFWGTILDFFYKSNKQNFELIEQFASGNPATIQQVNKQAMWAGVGIICLIILAVLMAKLAIWLLMSGYTWLMSVL